MSQVFTTAPLGCGPIYEKGLLFVTGLIILYLDLLQMIEFDWVKDRKKDRCG
jgi:hypothetical protein